MTAYSVKAYQITGPDFLDSERFDIVAKVPPGITKDQVGLLWQSFLAERFNVVLHRSSKVFDVEEIVPAKGGVKLKETTLDAATVSTQAEGLPPLAVAIPGGAGGPPLPPPPPPPGGSGADRGLTAGGRGPEGKGFPGMPLLDKNGVPQLNAPGLFMMMTMGGNGPSAHLVGKAQTIDQLATMVGNQMGKPVVNKTGLNGKYDFTVEFAPDMTRMPGMPPGPGGGFGPAGPGPGGDTGPAQTAPDPGGINLAGALQQQLGLKLVAAKAPLDLIVIDKAEKTPTEN